MYSIVTLFEKFVKLDYMEGVKISRRLRVMVEHYYNFLLKAQNIQQCPFFGRKQAVFIVFLPW